MARERYESDGGSWAVLDEECRWTAVPLPPSVYVSFARYVHLPAPSGGPTGVQAHALVTVHRDVAGAEREIAESAGESTRCERQTFSSGDQVGALHANVAPAMTADADELLLESGRFVQDDGYPGRAYVWAMARIGQTTVSVWVAGSQDETPEQTQNRAATAIATMIARLAAQGG